MQIDDIGIIIAKKPLKENYYILHVFTKNHGIYAGVIRKSTKDAAAYQIGNLVNFNWRARLHEHIGNAKCELIKSYSTYIMQSKERLYTFNSMISLIMLCFHEREPHNNFYEYLLSFIQNLSVKYDFKAYIRLELAILNEAGYGLDLTKCAVTGAIDDLKYISPKSGKAVSKSAGLPYKEKLLILPEFLVNENIDADLDAIKQSFELTSYFFNRYFFQAGKQILPRNYFIEYLLNKD